MEKLKNYNGSQIQIWKPFILAISNFTKMADKIKMIIDHGPAGALQTFFGNDMINPLQNFYQNPKENAFIFQNYMHMDTSFCLISCNMDILKKRINIFSVETSIHQFSNMASSGLKKMFILQYYIHKNVSQKMFSQITFFFFIMADVMPYVRLMLCLGWCYCLFGYGRFCIIWADVIAHVISFGRENIYSVLENIHIPELCFRYLPTENGSFVCCVTNVQGYSDGQRFGFLSTFHHLEQISLHWLGASILKW